CYNLGEFLGEALDSALRQTYPDFEIVLVDDGSTDPATVKYLDRLPAHPRLRMLRTPNKGLARARNHGIDNSSGVYILPLDPDDRILPHYLPRAVPILDSDPLVGFVGCHFRTFGVYEQEQRPAGYCLPDLLIENVVPVASVFRRSCWEQLGGYALNMRGIEDWDLWIGMLERGYYGEVLPEFLFEYRVRADSMMAHTRQPEIFRQRMATLYERHRDLYEAYRNDVLLGRDMQYARLLAHSHWLENQRRAWERVAHERLEVIDLLNARQGVLERRRIWWQRQNARLQRVMTENQSTTKRIQALAQGGSRVIRRKVRQYFLNRLPSAQQDATLPAQHLVARNVQVAAKSDLQAMPTESAPPELMEHAHIYNLQAVVEPSDATLDDTGRANNRIKSQSQDLAQAVKRWGERRATDVKPPGNAIVLDDYYPIEPVPRYGYGKPFPPNLLATLNNGLLEYQQTLESFLPFLQQLLQIPRDPNPERPADPAWINGFFPGLDSLSLFGFVSTLKPKLLMEIGSGNSTKFAAKAKSLNSSHTRIVSIDPYPRVEIDRLCDEIVRSPLESV